LKAHLNCRTTREQYTAKLRRIRQNQPYITFEDSKRQIERVHGRNADACQIVSPSYFGPNRTKREGWLAVRGEVREPDQPNKTFFEQLLVSPPLPAPQGKTISQQASSLASFINALLARLRSKRAKRIHAG
jgi:hypothetical protein